GLPENLPRVLGPDLGTRMAEGGPAAGIWELPPVFRWLRAAGGLEQGELLRTLNCGVGMVIVVSPERAEEAVELLRLAGEKDVIGLGRVEARTGSDSPQVVVEGELE
ncbi:unnamed protein product, partial [Discosporangium mesarthrocarpum]